MKAKILFDIVGGIEDLSIACYDDEESTQRLQRQTTPSHQLTPEEQFSLEGRTISFHIVL